MSRRSFGVSNHLDMSRWFGKSPWQVRDKPVCVVLMESGNEHDTTRQTDFGTLPTCHGEKRWRRGLPVSCHRHVTGFRGRRAEVGVMEFGLYWTTRKLADTFHRLNMCTCVAWQHSDMTWNKTDNENDVAWDICFAYICFSEIFYVCLALSVGVTGSLFMNNFEFLNDLIWSLERGHSRSRQWRFRYPNLKPALLLWRSTGAWQTDKQTDTLACLTITNTRLSMASCTDAV